MAAVATDTIRYHVTGMDCSSCAAKIEGAARKVEGVADVKVSIASQIMTLEIDNPAARLPVLESAVTGLGYQLDRIGEPKAEGAADDDDDDKIPDLSHVTPAYKRALWIVVLLNVGYPLDEVASSLGQPNTPRMALEQKDAKVFFQRLHAGADAGLRHAERIGGVAEVQIFGDGESVN